MGSLRSSWWSGARGPHSLLQLPVTDPARAPGTGHALHGPYFIVMLARQAARDGEHGEEALVLFLSLKTFSHPKVSPNRPKLLLRSQHGGDVGQNRK